MGRLGVAGVRVLMKKLVKRERASLLRRTNSDPSHSTGVVRPGLKLSNLLWLRRLRERSKRQASRTGETFCSVMTVAPEDNLDMEGNVLQSEGIRTSGNLLKLTAEKRREAKVHWVIYVVYEQQSLHSKVPVKHRMTPITQRAVTCV